jgi:hypothetical protein
MLENLLIPLPLPKKSQMALSTQVKESLEQASKHMREALAFASRTEHPAVISTISELLIRTECIESMDNMFQKLSQSK